MRQILFWAKNQKQIEANSKIFRLGTQKFAQIDIHSDQVLESVELDVMTKVFGEKDWQCYWTCLEWLNVANKTLKFINPISIEAEVINVSLLSEYFNVIIFRIIGTVEGKRDQIINTIDCLQNNFNGLIVNHPETMKYGIRKDYLLALQSKGFPVIPTMYFENSVSYDEIYKSRATNQTYIIKPITGELANSLTVLVDEKTIVNVQAKRLENGEYYLRRKQNMVGGWLLQPFIEDIWKGEYQLIFFGETFSHGCKKIYKRISDEMIVPSQENRWISLYQPTKQEKHLALSIKEYFEKELSKPIYSFRFDFLKLLDNRIQILEFEFLNPGFFIGYIDDYDERYKIALNFENEISKLLIR